MALHYLEKFSVWLGTDVSSLARTENFLEKRSGRRGVLESLLLENRRQTEKALDFLELEDSPSFEEIKEKLLRKTEDDDIKLKSFLRYPDLSSASGRSRVAEFVEKIKTPPVGFFLKESKAREFLIANPPKKVLAFLGFKTIEEALAKTNLLELFASLRFIEDADWLNNVFFKKYFSLSPNDFERRRLKIIILDEKWREASRAFMAHKRHNISHLKELGVIFILPLSSSLPGELVRTVSLLFHYLEEVPFYSGVAENLSSEKNFAESYVSLLRGDVSLNKPERENDWLVIQRYLEKDDPRDWRLSFPHINTESFLYSLAYRKISAIGDTIPKLKEDFEFWGEESWVGDLFSSKEGGAKMVSFDLLDNSMSLVSGKTGVFYSYHRHEALWNKIFAAYFGEEKIKEAASQNIISGFVPLS